MKEPSTKKGAGTGNPRGRGTYNPACDVCHRKKTKCDGLKPVCAPCRSSGRHLECSWTKNPARKPRTEMHFEAMHKLAENRRKLLIEYRRYADYLESLLDQSLPNHPHQQIDFRAARPADVEGLMGTSFDDDNTEFDFVLGEDDYSQGTEGQVDPTKELGLPTQSLKLEDGGIHYGPTAPFLYGNIESPIQTSRFPAIVQNPQAIYVLIVDEAAEEHYNPDFDWSRHLPTMVPLDRRSHDHALDLLFKFFTSWCLRMVPALFLRDMYRALSGPRSQEPPKTAHYSPMLHNAVVALALAFLDDPRFRDLRARQYFAEKAKSYMENECQKPNISVVQALSLLASFHSSQGDQTLGYLYFGMSARMAQALGLNVDCTEWVKAGMMEESERLDRNWANWTTFTQDVCWSLYVGRDFCVPAPDADFPPPIVDTALDQMAWSHGPANLPPQPNNLTKTFQATCELLSISRRIMDVINCLNKMKARPFVIDELISDIDLKLNTWRGSLSPELEITVKSRPTATPHKLMLHISYWWLFILLHRPFFHRKARPISSTDREIDHVKLCKRAAENIMELLGTWRSLYSLRYGPITLIQAVFSAGIVYLLSAMQAGSGVRIAQKELHQSMEQQQVVLQYLQEIGRSWQCATNIASIFRGLVQDQLKPLLERKILTTQKGKNLPALTIQDEDEEEVSPNPPSLLSRTSPIHMRRRSSTTKKQRLLTHSRNSSGVVLPSALPSSSSPVITISPPFQDSPATYASPSMPFSSTSPSVPISIQRASNPSSMSSSPSSFVDVWNLRQAHGSQAAASPFTPSPSSSPAVSYLPSPSPSTSFNPPPAFQGHPHAFPYQPPDESSSNSGLARSPSTNYEPQELSNFDSFSFDMSPQPPKLLASFPFYRANELGGFLGMPGGQTLPQAPFCSRFSLGDGRVAPLTTATSSNGMNQAAAISSQIEYVSFAPFGTGFLFPAPTSFDPVGHAQASDVDSAIDDLQQWEIFMQDTS
ncbi:fungal-specific transcription factor domain-containing protein [Crepidotus variabilis]|uniref:Fungal-specific transcription factor domain-containing protein n=1 Tax=Crepidotus variabilis TaxID=179855 RepID=A0A9P6JSS8_9AGAR|nr:fungal-specific transcription factor domain-containing protein [Crepidotus variabilis]